MNPNLRDLARETCNHDIVIVDTVELDATFSMSDLYLASLLAEKNFIIRADEYKTQISRDYMDTREMMNQRQSQ
jgi:hypothetical protein